MPIEKRRIRDGIAVREQTVFTFPLTEDEKKKLKRLSSSSTNQKRLETFENWARKVLQDAGLPAHCSPVIRHQDGSWSEISNDQQKDGAAEKRADLKPGDSISTVKTFLKEDSLTEETYAADVLVLCAAAREAKSRGDIDRAMDKALDLGLLIKEFLLNQKFGPDAVRGEKVRANKGGQQRPEYLQARRDQKTEWQQLADEYWHRHPTASKVEVARSIAKKTGHSFNTIRQTIKKPDDLPG